MNSIEPGAEFYPQLGANKPNSYTRALAEVLQHYRAEIIRLIAQRTHDKG